MFQIQRKIQQKVFGVRFWENVERSSKDNFSDPNTKNEFNPRHVQILMKMYQTGGAAALLTPTGDPNKGLRDWHQHQKEVDVPDVEDEAEKGNSKTTGRQRWNSLKETNANATQLWNSVRKSVADGGFVGKQSMERIKFKLREGGVMYDETLMFYLPLLLAALSSHTVTFDNLGHKRSCCE
jgi:hypothetical protein